MRDGAALTCADQTAVEVARRECRARKNKETKERGGGRCTELEKQG